VFSRSGLRALSTSCTIMGKKSRSSRVTECKARPPECKARPPYRQMIISAIKKCSSDSSFQSIVKYLLDNYVIRNDNDCAVQVKRALGKMLRSNDIIKAEENYFINDSRENQGGALPHSFHINLSNSGGAKVAGDVPLKDIQEFRPIAIISASKHMKVEVKRLVSRNKKVGVDQYSAKSCVVHVANESSGISKNCLCQHMQRNNSSS